MTTAVTDLFTGLAECYAKNRPTYSPEVIDDVLTRCALGPGNVVADVGAGTGIFTRLLQERGLRVYAVEPNSDMLEQAKAETEADGTKDEVTFFRATAEHTTLPPESVDAVVSAQAFHWFDARAALTEFCRILKPGGHVALVWNERDEESAIMRDYSRIVRTGANGEAIEAMRARAMEPLKESPLFSDYAVRILPTIVATDVETFIGRAFSVSYSPKEPAERARWRAELEAVFQRYAEEYAGGEWGQSHPNTVPFQYKTSVFVARKRDSL